MNNRTNMVLVGYAVLNLDSWLKGWCSSKKFSPATLRSLHILDNKIHWIFLFKNRKNTRSLSSELCSTFKAHCDTEVIGIMNGGCWICGTRDIGTVLPSMALDARVHLLCARSLSACRVVHFWNSWFTAPFLRLSKVLNCWIQPYAGIKARLRRLRLPPALPQCRWPRRLEYYCR